jgi:hypothetical protein
MLGMSGLMPQLIPASLSHLLAARAQVGDSLAFQVIFASLGVGLPPSYWWSGCGHRVPTESSTAPWSAVELPTHDTSRAPRVAGGLPVLAGSTSPTARRPHTKFVTPLSHST